VSRVIVVGSGVAGLIAALEASVRHEVVLVTKSQLAESNTRYAQGGIAAALFPDDSVESHIADTLVAGAGLCDPEAVRVLCAEGPDRVRDLIALGVAFDTDTNGELARGHEAAHSHKRVVHAGGDATGLAIELALVAAVQKAVVEVHENAFMVDLVVADGAVRGVELLTPAGRRTLAADAVILASGGAGRLYAHTTNPAVTTGDGIAAAWRAGAVLGDLEFYQFHPTSLAVPGNPLVSEAVRGEGAVLLASDGSRFMTGVHPQAELAPRDVVARGIAGQMARQDGAPVLLDATGLGRDFLAARFPGITAVCEAHGFDWAAEPIPVTPAAHYWMGGVRTDTEGRTSLPGLFGVGEVACTGVHGANRLASNSLLESLVFAWRAAHALDDGLGGVAAATPFEGAAIPGGSRLGEENEPASRVDRAQLRQLMWDAAGLYRNADALEQAAATLDGWTAASADRSAAATVAELEDRNLLDLGRLVVRSAVDREESRGAHFRSDFPDTSAAFAHHSSYRLTPEVALVD
jgi:L-aspartate oxidase